MERLRRILAGGTLALMFGMVAAGSGCRSMHDEVPPGPRYPTTGEPSSAAGFNSAPHGYNAMGSPYATNPAMGGTGPAGASGLPGMGSGPAPGQPIDGGMPPSIGSGASSFGTPAPGAATTLGQPTSNAYGPPGTSGTGR